ncbi:MAG: ABC transporter permease [Chloroflexota bacterium]
MTTHAASIRARSVADPGRVRRGGGGIWTNAAARLRRDHVTLCAGAILGCMILLALGADLLAAYVFHDGFTRQDLLNGYARPSLTDPALWLGSDDLGRSEIVRLLYGSRISLSVGVGAAMLNLTIGLSLGMTAGFQRGWLDDVVQFVISTVNSIPRIPLLLMLAVLFSPGPVTLVIIIGLLTWPNVSLFVRGQTLSLRERDFVSAGLVAGASTARTMVRHILPNVLPLVFVLTAIDVGSLILLESALSYLGFGVSPPTPSWGNMLTRATQDLSRGPWLVYAPGAAIFLTVLCLYLVGDGVRDALDPRINHNPNH